MRKQELIDAAEASGLSRAPIMYVNISDFCVCCFICCGEFRGILMVLNLDLYVHRAEKGRGKPGQFGSSPRDWYTGWSCMKTLVTKGLVVKSSCPAK